MSSSFDWTALEARFQQSTDLPGAVAGATDWWDRWHAHVSSRETPAWFYDRAASPAWFGTHWPALSQRWIEAGEGLLTDVVHAGDFRPARRPDGEIDWGANPDRSMSWGGFHYWSWANPLMRAYALTGDDRFPAAFATHLKSYFEQLDTFHDVELWEGAPADRDWNDWVTHNDLSAGIKMATFSEAVMVFAGSSSWSIQDLRRATLILLRLAQRLHATYCDTRLAADLLRNLNFLTSGAAGLGTVAAIFPECSWSTQWLGLAQRILEVHLAELYYPDGGHRELCTQYHKAGLRDILFLEQILVQQERGFIFNREPYRSQVARAIRFLARIRMPDGSTAVLNSAAASDDWLVFCAVANQHLKDPELAWHIERCFSTGYVPRQKSRPALCVRILGDGDGPSDLVTTRPRETSVHLPDSGIAVLRDGWDRWASAMVLDFGRPVGGHAYPARGSFSLYLRGRPACLSPGSPHAYTDPDYRGWMHTSRSQNAILIDDVDQEEWEHPGVRRVHGAIHHWHTDADTALVQGSHPGYGHLGITCTRTVLMVAGRFFLVHDTIDATRAGEAHVAKWSIHCPEPISETEGHAGVARGLIRIVPAWPGEIDTVETGSEGKAVYPGPSADGRTDDLRPLHQARWCTHLPAGATTRFLMLLHANGESAAFGAVTQTDEGLAVDVEMSGMSDRFLLPPAPASPA